MPGGMREICGGFSLVIQHSYLILNRNNNNIITNSKLCLLPFYIYAKPFFYFVFLEKQKNPGKNEIWACM